MISIANSVVECMHSFKTAIKKELIKSVSDGLLIVPDAVLVIDLDYEASRIRQLNVIMNEWKDKAYLDKINAYYKDYVKAPLFGENVMIRHADSGITVDNLIDVLIC
jgi:deoxyadenosine/deoxycytidine kinase